jgi:hypothetical protein
MLERIFSGAIRRKVQEMGAVNSDWAKYVAA